MTTVTIILLAVIVAVILIDLYLKRKNKLATTKEIEKVIDKENPEKKEYKKPVVIVTSILLLLIASFFGVNHQFYDGRLTDADDGISLLQNIIETQYNISDINFIGDSIYKFNDNTNANGLIYCEYGNIGMLINGKPNGLWTLYHANGIKKMRVLLINGKQEGIRTDWYSNGSKEFEGNYLDDKQTGVCRFWYKDGQMELEGEFKNGLFAGNYTRWYKEGSIKYIYNHQEKTYKEYWNNGNIYCEAKFMKSPNSPIPNGKPMGYRAKFYSEKDGVLIHHFPFNKYNPNGSLGYRQENRHPTGRACTHKEFYCKTILYYLNDDVFGENYSSEDGFRYWYYYEDGNKKEVYSPTRQTFYHRNGILNKIIYQDGSLPYPKQKKIEKFDEYGNVVSYFDMNTGGGYVFYNDKLFKRKKELYFPW